MPNAACASSRGWHGQAAGCRRPSWAPQASITIAGRRCIPFFVGGPAWAELGPDLRRHGLEYVTAPLAMASSLPDGGAAVAPVDPEAFAEELERLGETAGRNARACRCSTFHTHRGVTLPGHVRHGGVGYRNR